MSSPEFAELHGIGAHAVAKRCALLASPAKRELLWFIQGISIGQGLNWLTEELLGTYPERVGTKTMHSLGVREGMSYAARHAVEIQDEIECTTVTELARRSFEGSMEELLELDGWDDERVQYEKPDLTPVPWQDIFNSCHSLCRDQLPAFLTELCINPHLFFQINEATENAQTAEERLRSQASGSSPAAFRGFKDIIGALVDYKQRFEARVRAEFCSTAISRLVWKSLDEALKTRVMILVDGLEGRGKTEAVKAWCRCHLGVARFMSLDGTSTKTTQFREMAKALGIGHGASRKVSEMQANVKEVLRLSGLMPVIDEAHFFFNQGSRMYTRPEMLDWIDTALCNPPLPVALVTTPQFLHCMKRAVEQVGWNYRQFRRRCKRYVPLPPKNTPSDIESVVRHLLAGADNATIKQVIAYEALSKRDLSAVGDVVREAQLLAAGKKPITFEHVKRAIHEVLLVSDTPWAEWEERLSKSKTNRRSAQRRALPETETDRREPAPENRVASPRGVEPFPSANRARFQDPVEVLVGESE